MKNPEEPRSPEESQQPEEQETLDQTIPEEETPELTADVAGDVVSEDKPPEEAENTSPPPPMLDESAEVLEAASSEDEEASFPDEPADPGEFTEQPPDASASTEEGNESETSPDEPQPAIEPEQAEPDMEDSAQEAPEELSGQAAPAEEAKPSPSETGATEMLGTGAEQAIVITGIVRDLVDLVQIFDLATHENALDVSVSVGDSAGGVRYPAILQHPLSQGRSLLRYQLELPAVAEGERLVLAFSIGLRDGIPDDGLTRDGVRFAIEVAGKPLFSGFSDQCRWQDHLLDLTSWAGNTISLVFITDAGPDGNSSYDWALWGKPHILQLRHIAEGITEKLTAGWILAQPDDDETMLGGMEFDEPEGKSVEVLAEWGRQILAEGWGHPVSTVALFQYGPELEILELGPTNAVVLAGSDFFLQCTVRNRGKVAVKAPQRLFVSLEGVRLNRDRNEKEIRELSAGEEAQVRWHVRSFSRARFVTVGAKLRHVSDDSQNVQTLRTSFAIERPAPKLANKTSKELDAELAEDHLVLQNEYVRALFVSGPRGAGYAELSAARSNTYHPIALLAPLASFCYLNAEGGPVDVVLRPSHSKLSGNNMGEGSLVFVETYRDAEGANWEFEASFALGAGAKHLQTRYRLRVDRPRDLLTFSGPSLAAGDGSFGVKKGAALFPGLEYLEGDEVSSSTRDAEPPISLRLVPHPAKITVPLMAVEEGGMVAGLMWDPLQVWDGEHQGVSALFSSPNWYQRQENHLMRIFLPTVPDWVVENAEFASMPYALEPGREITLQAEILLDGTAHILDAVQHWTRVHGVPAPADPPRDDQAEILLSRHALMETVWDAERQASQHCVGWSSRNAPGFATLLWHDFSYTGDPAVQERVELIAQRTLQESGPQALVSPNNCHILRWEFPFYYGHLDEALEGMRHDVARILGRQRNNGGWVFEPTDERTATLGEAGDAVLGTCAQNAWLLLKYARITGEEVVLQAGLKVLNFMRGFKVPRGAQAWECPLYEPDILAAAHAVGAYLEAYRILEDKRHLNQAEYWARTGLPFLYHWQYADRPGMLYASIPVFGTTFHTHSWFGVPVQWNGLVYAYHVQHLAAYVNDPLWRTVAEGILVSAMHQQWAEGEHKGTYPDGFYGYCTDRRGPHINPENILVNLFALRGRDPDVKTQVLQCRSGRVHINSGADLLDVEMSADDVLSLRLKYVAGQSSHLLVTGIDAPGNVRIDGELLDIADTPDPAWHYDESRRYLFLKVPHAEEYTQVEIKLPAPMPLSEEESSPRRPPLKEEPLKEE